MFQLTVTTVTAPGSSAWIRRARSERRIGKPTRICHHLYTLSGSRESRERKLLAAMVGAG